MLSAQFLQRELPVRLAHRVAELENLPYGLSSKPQVLKVRGRRCVCVCVYGERGTGSEEGGGGWRVAEAAHALCGAVRPPKLGGTLLRDFRTVKRPTAHTQTHATHTPQNPKHTTQPKP